MGKRVAPKKKSKLTTTKKLVYLCVGNGILWVWCSYILAFIGALNPHDSYNVISIAENLSVAAVTQIVGVVLVYCLKSLFEKRENFGNVGRSELNERNIEEEIG